MSRKPFVVVLKEGDEPVEVAEERMLYVWLLHEQRCGAKGLAFEDFWLNGRHNEMLRWLPEDGCPVCWGRGWKAGSASEAMKDRRAICYVPELSSTQILAERIARDGDPGFDKMLLVSKDETYTWEDFLRICNHQEDLAVACFDICEWQHPETVWDEMRNDDLEYCERHHLWYDNEGKCPCCRESQAISES